MEEQIRLREATEADTDRIVAWRNDPKVMEHFFFRQPFTRESHLAWRAENVLTGKTKQFMICLCRTDRITGATSENPIGSCTLQNIQDDEAEYGFLIGEDGMRGKGYGTEAVLLAVDYARNILHLNSLTARVMADNEASRHTLEKVGFIVERETPEEIRPNGGTVTAVHLRKDL